jgi:hypothetical protein
MNKTEPFAIERFYRFSNKNWRRIVEQTAVCLHLDQWRRDIELAVFFYTNAQCYSHGPGFEIVGIDFEGESPPRECWRVADLDAEHRRLAKAARAFLAAYEPHLHPAWRDCAEWEAARPDLEALFEAVESTARHSERQIEEIKKEKDEWERLDREWPQPPSTLRDERLAVLVEDLIVLWLRAGGKIGASLSGGAGGPLVRFLRAVAGEVLESPPTVGMAQYWIRAFKQDCRSNRLQRPWRRKDKQSAAD